MTDLGRGLAGFRHGLARRQLLVSVTILALLAYVPALTAAPGRMPSDSKLYVYLDPGRFLVDTTTTFDPRQYAGWVPHQHIAYLWPTAPWFWVFEQVGVPDWVAHRLWIGTLLLAAGLGVRWVARVLGLGPTAALTAAIVYQLSPYILPYVSRTSVLLLPFAGLGWIVGLTVLAARRGRWRYAAGVALVVFTVGAVNATALAMIIPAPVLWLVHAVWQRSISWRRAVVTAAKVSVLSIGVSLWWIAMLVIQGRRGADVLAYSESLESVSFTSTSTEVLRGLGYWLFYIRDAFGATTTASLDHLASTRIIAAGIGLLTLCLLGLVLTAWEHRRYAALLVAGGTILAVGVHPIDDPSPVMSLLVGDGEGGLALALRSSTRAIPVLLLGLGLSAAALVSACQTVTFSRPVLLRTARVGTALAVVIAIFAVANLPSLRDGGFVDPELERAQDPPQAWLDAAAALDALPEGYRVLQLPGSEFGSFRWGHTVDQPLPGLTERALLTRDLLPLGSPAAMDLVFALDDRFQDGVVDVAAVAPIARLLGVDTIWVTDDIAFDRFRVARPEIVDDLLTGQAALDAGLLPVERFGAPTVMVPDIEVIDEQSVSDPRVGQPLSTVALVGVSDPVSTVRVKDTSVVVSGDGAGLVDAAAAGVIDGSELILYSASFEGDTLIDLIAQSSRLVVTDSNRDRAHHWRSSQDVTGYTESGGAEPGVLRYESGDQRLPVFDTADPATQTVSVQNGSVTASASSYGEPFAYLPEHRPVMAIDGDPATSWLVADRAPAIGEFISFDVGEPIDQLTLRQPDSPDGRRRISSVEVSVDGADPITVDLDDRSLADGGQGVDLAPTEGPSTIVVRITGTTTGTVPVAPIGDAVASVGFSEVSFGLGDETLAPTEEVIRVPTDGVTAVGGADTPPVSYVFTRLRTDPTDRWRSDPEPTMVREFEVAGAAAFAADVTLRADQRMDDLGLAGLLGEPVHATEHLTGVPRARGAAAFDGDPTTSWITSFGSPVGAAVNVQLAGTASSMVLAQPAGTFSPVTALRVSDQSGSFDVAVPAGETATITFPRSLALADATFEITAADERTTLDRRFGETVVLPAAIAEITFDGVSPSVVPTDGSTAECTSDLLSVDGQSIDLSFTATAEQIVSGAAIPATVCDPIELDTGTHVLDTAPAPPAGFQVDQVVLAAPAAPADGADDGLDAGPPTAQVTGTTRTSRTVEVSACPAGCWVVLGEGFNTAWSASTDDGSLGEPVLVDGNANGWWLEPTTTPTTVTFTWASQTTLNAALLASLIGVLIALALVFVDRRRAGDTTPVVQAPTLPRWPEWSGEGVGLATIAVATVSGAVFIGWTWGVVAAVLCVAVRFTGRLRLLGLAGLTLVVAAQLTMFAVVLRDRPYPNAGWPVRFEWLHPWTLLGVILLASATLFGRDAARPEETPDE